MEREQHGREISPRKWKAVLSLPFHLGLFTTKRNTQVNLTSNHNTHAWPLLTWEEHQRLSLDVAPFITLHLVFSLHRVNPVHNVTWLAVRFRKVKRIPTVNGPLLSVYSMRLLAIKVRAIMNIPLITEVL